MEYIVLDLEWNQSNTGKEDAVEKLPFEIIEIGAIKLNKERVMVSEFNELIKPQVYHEMHKITSKLIHIQMQELERGRPFPEVGGDFVRLVRTGRASVLYLGNVGSHGVTAEYGVL